MNTEKNGLSFEGLSKKERKTVHTINNKGVVRDKKCNVKNEISFEFVAFWRGKCVLHSCSCINRMTEVKGARRRRTQLFDYLINRRRYRELKEEAEDRKR